MGQNNQESQSWWNGDSAPAAPSEATGLHIDEPSNHKSGLSKGLKIGLCAGASVLLIGAIILAVVLNLPKTTSESEDVASSETEDSESSEDTTKTAAGSGEQSMSVALSSGSVTTTIGGKSVTYNAAYLVDGIDVTIDGGTFESTTDDQVTFLVINGGSLTIDGDVLVNKTGSANFSGRGDNYSFYGTNSVITVVGSGSSVTINGATIASSVSGANAVVATNGATATVNNATIATTKDNSRGLHATYTGVITADNTKISTQGGSCASLATDRGTGTVTASNMTLSTAGAGSPLIYSTGNITVSNSKGTATGAQIAVVEGENSITLDNCDFSANGIGNRNNVDNAAVMIYQSMSGDADTGTGNFTAKNCTLSVLETSSVYESVPFFFITNTSAVISLENVTASFSSSEKFISALGTSEWGRSGSNGGKVKITASNLAATNTEVETDSVSSVSGL